MSLSKSLLLLTQKAVISVRSGSWYASIHPRGDLKTLVLRRQACSIEISRQCTQLLITDVARLCLQLLLRGILPSLLSWLHQWGRHGRVRLIRREARETQRLGAVHHDRPVGLAR